MPHLLPPPQKKSQLKKFPEKKMPEKFLHRRNRWMKKNAEKK